MTNTLQHGPGIVFEHFEQSLRDFLSESSEGSVLHPDFMRHIFCSMANGLAQVHGTDVIHGDLRPGNILVELTPAWKECFPNPGFGNFEDNLRVVLADFGSGGTSF